MSGLERKKFLMRSLIRQYSSATIRTIVPRDTRETLANPMALLRSLHGDKVMNMALSVNSEAIDKRMLRRQTNENHCEHPEVVRLDATLSERGVLLEDCSLLLKTELDSAKDLNDVKMMLYGDNAMPILRRDMLQRGNPCMSTEMRRQFLIETLMSSGSVIEYRMFARAMAEKGMWGGINDLEIRPIWDAWVSALTLRIQHALDSVNVVGRARSEGRDASAYSASVSVERDMQSGQEQVDSDRTGQRGGYGLRRV